MKKFIPSPLYIDRSSSVTPETSLEQPLELDTDTILRIIDLLFLGREDDELYSWKGAGQHPALFFESFWIILLFIQILLLPL